MIVNHPRFRRQRANCIRILLPQEVEQAGIIAAALPAVREADGYAAAKLIF